MAEYEFYATDCPEPPADVLSGIAGSVIGGTMTVAGLAAMFDTQRQDALWYVITASSVVWICLCAMQALFLVGQLSPSGLAGVYLNTMDLVVCTVGIFLSAASMIVSAETPPPRRPQDDAQVTEEGYTPVPEEWVAKPNHV